MKKIIIFVVIIFVVIGVGYYIFNKLNQTNNQIAGGDKDEYGCIDSAGYSWCEAKQKCIRVWEEDCLLAEEIKSALAIRHDKEVSKVFIEIKKEDTKYAIGNVWFDQKGGEGGGFLAVKVGDKWEIAYDGNGSINCENIKQNYEFPQEMLIGFCD